MSDRRRSDSRVLRIVRVLPLLLLARLAAWATAQSDGAHAAAAQVVAAAVEMIASGDLPPAMLQSLGRVFGGFAVAALDRDAARPRDGHARARSSATSIRWSRASARSPRSRSCRSRSCGSAPARRRALMIVAYAAFFPIVVNTVAGAKRVDPTLLRAAATMGVDAAHRLRTVVVPGALPSIGVGPAHRAGRRLDGDHRRRARRRREGRRRRLRRHRPDDVRVLRVQHRAQPHRRLHDRGRRRRARCSTGCSRARRCASADAMERRHETPRTPPAS